MAKIYKSAEELIGHTPLLELSNIEKKLGLCARLIAKLESFNPAGSAKDRVAKAMLDDAEARGILTKDSVIIEPTSGNTGIGLASVAAARGYRCIIVMPDSMSVERITLMKAYGAELVLTDGALGMNGAIAKAEQMTKEIPGSFVAGQFVNPANSKVHRETTGPEIWKDTDGEVDIFVAGVGTGGTITGVGEYLKSVKPDVTVVAVEPSDSPYLSRGIGGAHKIQGIGAGFVPEVLNTAIYDEIITVTADDSYSTGRMLGVTEGILCGISSGAALWAGIELAKREKNYGKTIVVLLPDTGDRYLSTEMFKLEGKITHCQFNKR
ncbi:MAG: cysteine synthase A [Ruminococcaceae bacterium]|nr:cysteine synthase A [Oscillospiraceae bacterium]